MRIAVLGTGIVGRTVSVRLAELGHSVLIGTRSPEASLARTEPDWMGNPPLSVWASEHPELPVVAFDRAAVEAELVVNATNGSGSLSALTLAGADNLAGKVLIDISNALDFSRGFPPTLFVKDDDSLAEQIQRAFPDVRVVKALNTMSAHVMVHPDLLSEATSVFLSGDDPDAKATVRELLTSFGHSDIIDLGDLSTARGPEMALPLWLRVTGAIGTPTFNFKIVR